MALTATMFRFRLELSDMDRGVYESLDLRVARHPSEDDDRMLVRVLAYAICFEAGLQFGRGLSDVEDPALWVPALGTSGAEIELWIDVGVPSAERLHRAKKKSSRLVIVTHKSDDALKQEWGSRKIFQADKIEVIQIPWSFVREVSEVIDRSVQWYVSIQDGILAVSMGEKYFEASLKRSSLSGWQS